MAELPKYDELMFATLVVIDELGGSASIEEIQEKLIEVEGFTEDQMSVTYPKSGAVILPDRIAGREAFFAWQACWKIPKRAFGFSRKTAVQLGRGATLTSDSE